MSNDRHTLSDGGISWRAWDGRLAARRAASEKRGRLKRVDTLISLLRGINVNGQKTVRMAELKAAYEALGFSQVSTYVQSGNVVFDCASADPGVNADLAAVASLIEAEIERRFGFPVSVMVRRPEDFRRLIAGNPFVQRGEDPSKLHVTFLASASALAQDFQAPAALPDEYILNGQEIYLFCPDGYGRTKLSNNFFERKLKVNATTRNWKTVMALDEVARGVEKDQ